MILEHFCQVSERNAIERGYVKIVQEIIESVIGWSKNLQWKSFIIYKHHHMRCIQFSTQVQTGWCIYIVHHILEYFQQKKKENKNIKGDIYNQSNHRAYRKTLLWYCATRAAPPHGLEGCEKIGFF